MLATLPKADGKHRFVAKLYGTKTALKPHTLMEKEYVATNSEDQARDKVSRWANNYIAEHTNTAKIEIVRLQEVPVITVE